MNDNTNDRWLASLCYLSVIVLVPIVFVKDKSDFLARHCRQGFALFFAEVVALLILAVLDATVGHIPVLGLLISIILHLAVSLAALAVSVLGFVRAISGETWHIPFIDEIADRIPVTSRMP